MRKNNNYLFKISRSNFKNDKMNSLFNYLEKVKSKKKPKQTCVLHKGPFKKYVFKWGGGGGGYSKMTQNVTVGGGGYWSLTCVKY